MPDRDLAVSVRGLSKSYTIAHNAPSHTTLAEAFVHTFRRPLAGPDRETFWALRDVEFDIRKGDVVGIIGRNGAGKSTLLKILSRITEPTTGCIDLYGRVGSLLEVGTGFHPELTGRENISMNGAILGMSKREIARQFDAIVEFAEVAQFLDTPVKRYSSGMYVRLAFAVAAHLNPEILIVDEVLAVGDAQFQKKCLSKMQDVAEQEGRTVLFVSHNMAAVSLMCTRGILLQKGTVAYAGDTREAVDRYLLSYIVDNQDAGNAGERSGSGEYRLTEFTPDKPMFDPGEPKTFGFGVEKQTRSLGRYALAAHIYDSGGAVVAQCDSRLVGQWYEDGERTEGRMTLATPWLKPGDYRVNALVISPAGTIVDDYQGACTFSVSPIIPYTHTGYEDASGLGQTYADFRWSDASGSVGKMLSGAFSRTP